VAFSAQIFVEETFDARRFERQLTDEYGKLWTPAGAVIEATVENLSKTGCRLRMSALLPMGTIVQIAFAGTEARQARIVYRDGTAYGCEFLSAPIDAPTLELVPVANPTLPVSIVGTAARISLMLSMVFLPWALVAWVASVAMGWTD
jgi:hypothetical protein